MPVHEKEFVDANDAGRALWHYVESGNIDQLAEGVEEVKEDLKQPFTGNRGGQDGARMAVADARGQTLEQVAVHDRTALNAPRTPGAIGFSSLRAGDIVGEHTVTFATAGERVEITHRATDRITFARGALRAADWLAGQPAGLYGMKNVLGL